MSTSVLVTGGAGFIGSHVSEAYVRAGYHVTVLDDLSRGRRENVPRAAEFIHADIRSLEARRLAASGRFSLVNHHAAQIDVRRSMRDPQADAAVNLDGFLNILEGVRTANVGRFVFASSGGAIYADGLALPHSETASKLPTSPYGVAKLSAEHYLAAFGLSAGLQAVTLRYSNVYGPRQDPEGEGGVVAVFANRAIKGQPLHIYGDGEQTRDFVYVTDVAAANLAASRAPAPDLRDLDSCAFNVGTGVETSINQLAALIQRTVGRQSEVRYAERQRSEVRRSAITPAKAQLELAWKPETSLQHGLSSTIGWLTSSFKTDAVSS